jgi:hypothetical protein
LAAHDYIVAHYPRLDKDEKRHLKLEALHGVEIVDNVTRLCAMNMMLHGIGPTGNEAELAVSIRERMVLVGFMALVRRATKPSRQSKPMTVCVEIPVHASTSC